MGRLGFFDATLEEVLLVVSDLLLEVAVPPPAQRYGKMFVGPVEAARGLSFEAVFVPGLAEKLFPHKIVEEPLLDTMRAPIVGELDHDSQAEGVATRQHRR
jgi:ATP-dependent helicase/nuclease subunit B